MNPTPANQPPPPGWWARKSTAGKILVVFLGFVAFSAVRGALVRNGTITDSQPTSSANAPTADAGITMEKYTNLYTGMPYVDVVQSLGSAGTEMSSNDIGGTHTVLYQWKAGFMANVIGTFQNGRLVSKAQSGLQ